MRQLFKACPEAVGAVKTLQIMLWYGACTKETQRRDDQQN
jgi:hypothetical protein